MRFEERFPDQIAKIDQKIVINIYFFYMIFNTKKNY